MKHIFPKKKYLFLFILFIPFLAFMIIKGIKQDEIIFENSLIECPDGRVIQNKLEELHITINDPKYNIEGDIILYNHGLHGLRRGLSIGPLEKAIPGRMEKIDLLDKTKIDGISTLSYWPWKDLDQSDLTDDKVAEMHFESPQVFINTRFLIFGEKKAIYGYMSGWIRGTVEENKVITTHFGGWVNDISQARCLNPKMIFFHDTTGK